MTVCVIATAQAQDYRSIDGSGNNIVNPSWGAAGTQLMRRAAIDYEDGMAMMGGMDRPNPRVISNTIVDTAGVRIINDRLMSAMVHVWGQFIDHDIGLTPGNGTEMMPIPIPMGDPYFDPEGNGNAFIMTTRSVYDESTGDSLGNPRQQMNIITTWIDGSMVYGSDEDKASKLRSHIGGRLKIGVDGLLPINNLANFPEGIVPMDGGGLVPVDQCYAAGDIRANENVELTSLHTLFVREHNHVADRIAAANPTLDDEAIYQEARAWVIAEIQAITYNEWLPALLGNTPELTTGNYNPTLNPGLINEFSSAAFRLGHSLLGDGVEFLDDSGAPMAEPMPLSMVFFNPPVVAQHGIEPILKYLASDAASELDNKIVDGVRNFLFGRPGAGGLDLACLNIMRGRDHGLASYKQARRAFGMPMLTSFSQITSNVELQAKLEELYGDVNDIDLWVGLLAEDHLSHGSVGPTLRAILIEQFVRLRRADRYWYERVYSGRKLDALRSTTLAKVIRRNTSLENVQDNVFFFRAGISGKAFVDRNDNGTFDSGESPLSGLLVDLIASGTNAAVATVMTNSHGDYSFGVADGLLTGAYTVRLRSLTKEPLAESGQVAITRGDEFIDGINLGAVLP